MDFPLIDILRLQENIKKRQVAGYQVQLAIVQNPHTEDPQKLMDHFNSEMEIHEEILNAEFDQKAADQLKELMAKGSAFNVK